MSTNLNVGIDISLRKGAVSFLNQEGKHLGKVFEIPNSPSGFDHLNEKISQAVNQYHFQQILLGLEATSNYGFHLMDYFTRTTLLCEIKVYQINAKYIKRFKKAFPEREKTDLVDAQFIAEYLRFGKLPVDYKPEALHLPLKRLVRYRYHLVKSIEREKKVFIANLFLLFPGWVQERPIKTLGANSLRTHNEEYQAYYLKKYHEVSTHQHKRVLVLTARKLVRLVFALLAKNQLYDPQRRFQSPVASCEEV